MACKYRLIDKIKNCLWHSSIKFNWNAECWDNWCALEKFIELINKLKYLLQLRMPNDLCDDN